MHSMLCDVPGWALSLMQASHNYRRRLPPLNAVSFSGTCELASPQRSPAIEALLEILGSLQRLVDSHPPAERSLRYGNPAFRHAGMMRMLAVNWPPGNVWFGCVSCASATTSHPDHHCSAGTGWRVCAQLHRSF